MGVAYRNVTISAKSPILTVEELAELEVWAARRLRRMQALRSAGRIGVAVGKRGLMRPATLRDLTPSEIELLRLTAEDAFDVLNALEAERKAKTREAVKSG